MKKEFQAVIEEGHGGGAWIAIPFDVAEVYETRGRVAVKASFDGQAYRGSIAPMGGGQHILGITKAIRQSIGKSIGDKVRVILERDSEERTVEIPSDLARELRKNRAARENFEKFSYTNRKELVRSLESAKKPETRARRLREALTRLRDGAE